MSAVCVLHAYKVVFQSSQIVSHAYIFWLISLQLNLNLEIIP